MSRSKLRRIVTWLAFMLTVSTIAGVIGGLSLTRSGNAYLDEKKASAQQWVDNKVKTLMSLPTREVVVRRGDSPSTIYRRCGIEETIVSNEAVNISFKRLNPGASLWPGDVVIAPYRAMNSSKIAQK